MASGNSAESRKYHRVLIMKQKFKKSVDSGDLEGTRLSLANEMMLDPRGESFIEMREYAESSLPQLYDVHNGEHLDMNQDNWDETLLFSTKNALDNNFSKERLDFYYDLAKVVLKDKAAKLNQEQKENAQYEEADSYSSTSNGDNKGNPLYIGATICGLVIGGAGLLMGKAVIATIGLVGAAIGGGLLYNENKTKK